MTTPKKPRLTPTEREAFTRRVVARYADGASIRTIAVEEGWSYGGIHRVLIQADVYLRPRGGAGREPRKAAR